MVQQVFVSVECGAEEYGANFHAIKLPPPPFLYPLLHACSETDWDKSTIMHGDQIHVHVVRCQTDSNHVLFLSKPLESFTASMFKSTILKLGRNNTGTFLDFTPILSIISTEATIIAVRTRRKNIVQRVTSPALDVDVSAQIGFIGTTKYLTFFWPLCFT